MTDKGQPTFDPARFSRYEMYVHGAWSRARASVAVQIFGVPHGGGEAVQVGGGRATLRHMGGEPTDVRVLGWLPGHDWDLIGNGAGPSAWVCAPRWLGEAS